MPSARVRELVVVQLSGWWTHTDAFETLRSTRKKPSSPQYWPHELRTCQYGVGLGAVVSSTPQPTTSTACEYSPSKRASITPARYELSGSARTRHAIGPRVRISARMRRSPATKPWPEMFTLGTPFVQKP